MLERKWRGYASRISVQVESPHYIAKTVEHWDEWLGVLRLRHEVFHQQAMGRSLLLGVDVDDIDFLCDSLAIVDRETKEIVATYRLTSSEFSPRFYSQNKFSLGNLTEDPGIKIELGRACVRSDARNGSTLQLLWRGVSAYMEAAGADTLFGSASIRSRDPRDAAAVCLYLIENGHYASVPLAHPNSESSFPGLQRLMDQMPSSQATERARAVLPPLFQSYLRAGAKVICPPAMDDYLGSTDFLTVLRVKEMRARFQRKFRARLAKAV